MIPNIRTDLAMEAYEMLSEAAEELSGITVSKEDSGDIQITRVEVKTKEAEQQMGKPMGTYVTMEIPDTKTAGAEEISAACRALADEIKLLADLKDDTEILVVGLGNWNVTPDALGPQVVEKLMVTRHLLEYIPQHIDEGIRPVCAISPGVLGITGMETGEIIRGVAEKIKPDLVICIDALAARSIERVSTTVQLCNTGIAPGAGVGNKRRALNAETLGVPVIAIGVPTVIDAATITADTLSAISSAMAKSAGEKSPLYPMLSSMNRDEQFALAKEALSPNMGDFIVTPKEVDMMIDKVSRIVADGINLALHKGIDFGDIEAYVS